MGDETVSNKTEVCVISVFKQMRTRLPQWVTCVASSEHSCSARARERCKVFGVTVNRTLKFERRSRAANGDDYERKTLWSRVGLSRTPVFSPVLSLCCRGIISYTSYSRTNDCIYNGYDTAYTFTQNNSMLESNAMNNIDTVAHMNMHYTQY